MREAATICPAPCKLTFDLLTLKWCPSHVWRWLPLVQILVFLGLSDLDLGPMYATDRPTDVRQTYVRLASSLNASALWGRGHNKTKQINGHNFQRQWQKWQNPGLTHNVTCGFLQDKPPEIITLFHVLYYVLCIWFLSLLGIVHTYTVVKVVLWSRGGGSPDEARLEQTPYPFQPH